MLQGSLHGGSRFWLAVLFCFYFGAGSHAASLGHLLSVLNGFIDGWAGLVRWVNGRMNWLKWKSDPACMDEAPIHPVACAYLCRRLCSKVSGPIQVEQQENVIIAVGRIAIARLTIPQNPPFVNAVKFHSSFWNSKLWTRSRKGGGWPL
jgi:hypothetical protein